MENKKAFKLQNHSYETTYSNPSYILTCFERMEIVELVVLTHDNVSLAKVSTADSGKKN